jgi:hypothetical protein
LEQFGAAKTDRYLLFAERPEDVASGNWIQNDPEKGWFVLFLFYNPLPPCFDKSWRPGTIEEVK